MSLFAVSMLVGAALRPFITRSFALRRISTADPRGISHEADLDERELFPWLYTDEMPSGAPPGLFSQHSPALSGEPLVTPVVSPCSPLRTLVFQPQCGESGFIRLHVSPKLDTAVQLGRMLSQLFQMGHEPALVYETGSGEAYSLGALLSAPIDDRYVFSTSPPKPRKEKTKKEKGKKKEEEEEEC